MKKRILCLFFAVLLLFSIFPLSVFADETTTDGSEGELESMDLSKTSIKYDFEYVFFNAFKLEDYKPNAAKGNIELITMTETRSAEGNIELYVYVYNPSQKTIFENQDNMITMSLSEEKVDYKNFTKYQLERVQVEYATKNTQLETNASIIKYKLSDYSLQISAAFRSYGISEIELSLKNGLQSFTVGKSFEFTESEDGMFSVDYGTFEVMSLGIGHTYYRVLTEHGNSVMGYKDIRSVYFAVDNNKVKNAGVLDSIDISFSEWVTKPILVVDDKDVYDEFYKYIGKSFPDDFEYGFGSALSSEYQVDINPTLVSLIDPIVIASIVKGVCGNHGARFNYVINPNEIPSRFIRGDRNFLENLYTAIDVQKSLYLFNNKEFRNNDFYNNEIEKLYWLFELDSYDKLSGEKLLTYIENYNGSDLSWDEELFDETGEIQNITITRKDKEKTGSYYSFEQTKFDLWKSRYYGNCGTLEKQASIKYDMLEKFETKDLDLENEELADKYLIEIDDVEAFRKFVRGNADSTVYMLRYAITDTVIEEGAMLTNEAYRLTGLPAVFSGFTSNCYVCTSSLAQTTVIKGFDIIKLTYVNKLGEYTVFPIGITPTNHAPNLEHPNKPDGDYDLDNELEEFLKAIERLIKIIVIIAVIALIVYAFFVFSPYISAFFSRMGWGGGSNVNTNVNINLSDEVEKKKNEVKKDEEKTD